MPWPKDPEKLKLAKQRASDARSGKKASTETRRKMSEAHRGERNHFYGKTHTEESRRKISEAATGRVQYVRTEAQDLENSRRSCKMWENEEFRQKNHKERFGLYYAGSWFCSKWEITFAKFLDAAGVPWEYEPGPYVTPTGNYFPDFLTPFGLIEIKGCTWYGSPEKYEWFSESNRIILVKEGQIKAIERILAVAGS